MSLHYNFLLGMHLLYENVLHTDAAININFICTFAGYWTGYWTAGYWTANKTNIPFLKKTVT